VGVATSRNDQRPLLWVPAFAATTPKFLWRLADIEHAT
jgi:hypothetical protein